MRARTLALMLLGAFGAYLALLLHPDPLFAHEVRYENVVLHSPQALPPQALDVARRAHERLVRGQSRGLPRRRTRARPTAVGSVPALPPAGGRGPRPAGHLARGAARRAARCRTDRGAAGGATRVTPPVPARARNSPAGAGAVIQRAVSFRPSGSRGCPASAVGSCRSAGWRCRRGSPGAGTSATARRCRSGAAGRPRRTSRR